MITLGAVIAAILTAVSAGAQGSNSTQAAQRDFNAGNYAVAISKLQPLVMQGSANAEAFFWLGRCYFEIADYDSAISQFERAVSLEPKNSIYQMWLGRAYGGKADRDRSFSLAKRVKKQFQTAVALNPSNIEARGDLEEYCLDAPWIVGGSKDEALEQVNAIAAMDPVQGHLARARYDRDALKKPDQEAIELRQVLAEDPKTPDPFFDAASFFQHEQKAADMATAIQAAARANRSDPRLAYYRGVQGVLANKDLSDAEQNLKAYLASTPDRSDWPSHASARDWLGRLYEAEGKRPEAAEQFRAALQLDPKMKDADVRLSHLEKSK